MYSKQQCDDLQCHENFKLYDEYVQELECRLKKVTLMEIKQRTDQKNIPV